MCTRRYILFTGLLAALPAATAVSQSGNVLSDPREIHLDDVRQLTSGAGENAEAYWSPDGTSLIFQSTRTPYACDQIFTLPISDPAAVSLVSTGAGRTTCGYFSASGDRIVYSSTHASSPQCPAPPDRSRGYVWPIYDSYQIYSAAPDGSDLVALTDTDAYDAEATVCSRDGSIVFTSTRDGDLDLYRMDADGGNVRRLTDAPGYDGGAFFSPDCSQIVWRASRPTGEALAEYQALLAEGLVRPSELEIWVANADGTEQRQVTYLGGANFAPYFYPNGRRIIFSTNHHDPSGREFDLFAVDVDGTRLERITYTEGFDGFPMFSPDGSRLAFGSNRNQSEPGETDVYVARWIDAEPAVMTRPADRYLADVAWLADDARGGRGLGTDALAAAADWIEVRFAEIGLEPAAGNGSYRQTFEAIVDVERGPASAVAINNVDLPPDDFVIAGFSANSRISAPVVYAGWGIVSEEHGLDDYADLDVTDRIVLVRRYTPNDGVFADEDTQRRLGDLRYKAFTARERGAAGLLVADLAEDGAAETPLPALRVDPQGDVGIAVAIVTRAWAEPLLTGAHSVDLSAELIEHTREVDNIIGRLTASERLPGAVLLGAHFDHLGLGDRNSLAPGSNEPHNGADDNASGVAALLEAARVLAERRDTLRRDVVFAAFTGEESGLLGSSRMTREPPPGTAPAGLVAMLNLDMVGRLRENTVAIIGGESADEWSGLVEPICDALQLRCRLGGSGYGPSDQTPFYAAGVPVLHFFTGAHEEYHKPGDDTALINAAGGVLIANVVAELAAELTGIAALTYRESDAPAPRGDLRGYGASLGTIPDYTGATDDRPGMLVSAVRAGGPAARAGLQRGDRVVELAGREVRDVYDLMYVLRTVRPGEASTVVVERDGERFERPVTFGESTRSR